MQYKSSFWCFFVFFVAFLCENGFSTRYQAPSLCPQLKLKNGRVKFRQRGRFAKFSCNVGYMLAGERYSICSNGVWDMAPPKCVRATCMQAPKAPTNGLIFPSHGGAGLNFYCRPGYQLRGPLVIYCDGQQWDGHLPTCLPNGVKPSLFCDFEDADICGWTHDLNHDFEWRRENYQTPSGAIGTGPSFDHTKGKGKDGHYMYIETSSRNENDTARLISPVFDKTNNNTCLEFFYHMFGATTGTLRVYLRKTSEKWPLPASSAIFSKSGNQGDKWYRSFHSLGSVDEDFQIIIEGVRGPGYVSDTAIDDVKIIENCVESDYITTEESTVSASSESPPNVESCENRCGSKDLKNSSRYLISCDCDDSCLENNRCCPDYYDFCVSFESSTTEWYISTDIPNEIMYTTSHTPNKIPDIIQLFSTQAKIPSTTTTAKKQKTTTPPPSTTTLRPKTTTKRVILTSPTTKTTPKTVLTTKITKPLTSTKVETVKTTPSQKKFNIKPTIKPMPPVTLPTKKPVIILQNPPTTPEIIRKILKPTNKSTKLIFVKPNKPKKPEITNTDVMNVPQPSDKDEELIFPSILTTHVPLEEDEDASFFDKEDYAYEIVKNLESPYLKKEWAENEKLYTEKDSDAKNNHNLIILIISVASSIFGVVAFLGIIVLWLRRNRLNQCRTRRMNGGNGDSQSDVRFLTGDETLDFTLDRDCYDDL